MLQFKAPYTRWAIPRNYWIEAALCQSWCHFACYTTVQSSISCRVCPVTLGLAAAMAPLTLHYAPVRGRAEVFRLMCAAINIDFGLTDIDWTEMKENRTTYPFGQCPRLVDGDVDICQSNAMIRHMARKHGMYGSGYKEMATVDMFIDGVEAIRSDYVSLIYKDELAAEAKAAYWQTHGAKESSTGRNGGAHFAYLEHLLARSNGGSGFAVGNTLTAADLCVWEIVDLHLRIFKEEMQAAYPVLVAHHARIAELPGIKEYVASPERPVKVNGNNLG